MPTLAMRGHLSGWSRCEVFPASGPFEGSRAVCGGSGGTVPTSAPFGEGYGVSETLDSADLRFTGFDRDVAADQWISPTRQLAVVTGRWTSPDPSGLSV